MAKSACTARFYRGCGRRSILFRQPPSLGKSRADCLPPPKNVANWFPGALKVQILFALFFISLSRVTYSVCDRSTESASPPARCRCHFQHESAKAETPKPLWTNQILGFSKFRFSGFRVGGISRGGKPLAWQTHFFSWHKAAPWQGLSPQTEFANRGKLSGKLAMSFRQPASGVRRAYAGLSSPPSRP